VTLHLESVSIFHPFWAMGCCRRNEFVWRRSVGAYGVSSVKGSPPPALFSQVIIGLRVRAVILIRALLGIRYSHSFTR
jgi:hypothetical protein